MLKRILCALLCGAMLLPLASCSESDVNNAAESKSTVSNTPEVESGETEEETKKYIDDMPETMDFGGLGIRFIVEEGANGNLSEQSIYVEEDTGDVVDSAVYNRNIIVNDRLGVEVTLLEAVGYTAVAPLLRTSVQAGSNEYDVVGVYQYYGAGLATEGLLYNLNELKYNDFSREYWGTQYIDNMSYKGISFWATGDLALRYTGGMYVTYINDRLWTDYYSDTNIYDIVDEGAWTIDKMYEYSQNVYVDANADAKVDINDTVGLALICNDLIDGMAAGAMVEFGRLDEEGKPYISLNNERTYVFYDKMYKLLYNNPGYVEPSDDDSVTLMNKFNEGKYMMTVNKLYQSAIYLRDMEDDFKIIPLPKLDETQEHYNTRIHDSVTLFGVPITALENADAISATLEALSSESYRLVSPAYYETALKVKFTRDSDSGRMIDLISQNISCDFVTLYSNTLSNVNHFFRNNLGSKTESIASKFKGVERSWVKIMDKFLESIEKANHID